MPGAAQLARCLCQVEVLTRTVLILEDAHGADPTILGCSVGWCIGRRRLGASVPFRSEFDPP